MTPLALLIAILIFYVFDYDRYSNLFIYCICISIAYIASNGHDDDQRDKCHNHDDYGL